MKNEIMGRPEVNALIGMTIGEAITHLENHGLTLRVTVRDGRSEMVKGDIDMDRVNVFVEGKEIVEIDKIG